MAKILKLCFCFFIIVTCGLGFYFRPEKPHFIWQQLPVYDAIMGFFGCIIIILASKALGHNWLQKEEDYYDE